MTNNNDDYEMCLRAENVILPKNGYFGISSATGGLADDHDVFHFLTTSLHAPGQMTDPVQENQQAVDDTAKLSQEYQDYQKKLEIQKEEYRKEHPDAAPVKDDMEDWFESDNQRELRQIWQAQSSMTEVLRDLSRKMDDVIVRQERTIGMVSGGVQQQPQQPGQPPQVGVQVPMIDTIRRHEVDSLMTSVNILITTVREIRVIAGEIHSKSESIIQTQARQPTAQISNTGYDVQSLMSEMRDGMNQVKAGVAAVGSRINAAPQGQIGCPTPNCLGLTSFLIAIAVQLGLMLAYSLFK